MANHKDMISSEEARIMLLEQRSDDFHQALIRIDTRFENLERKIDSRFDQIDGKFETLERKIDGRFNSIESRIEKLDLRIDSNFKWLLGFIIPGFLGLLGIMAHGFHWF